MFWLQQIYAFVQLSMTSSGQFSFKEPSQSNIVSKVCRCKGQVEDVPTSAHFVRVKIKMVFFVCLN